MRLLFSAKSTEVINEITSRVCAICLVKTTSDTHNFFPGSQHFDLFEHSTIHSHVTSTADTISKNSHEGQSIIKPSKPPVAQRYREMKSEFRCNHARQEIQRPISTNTAMEARKQKGKNVTRERKEWKKKRKKAITGNGTKTKKKKKIFITERFLGQHMAPSPRNHAQPHSDIVFNFVSIHLRKKKRKI